MIHRRSLALLPAGLLAAPALAQEAAWPSRPVRVVVAFPPGGLTDVAGRMMAERLQAELGQTVVVENRGGAGGTTGTQMAVRAAPDGYTLAVAAPSTHVTGPILFPSPGYDGVSDVGASEMVGELATPYTSNSGSRT